MQIAFRVDASLQIGTGHVMRCLALADALQERGGHCLFACRPHSGHMIDLIENRGHQVVALPALVVPQEPIYGDLAHASWLGTTWQSDAAETGHALAQLSLNWLVVDHYALDWRWEQALRPRCKHLMVIDDLADRPHACDVLLDQNLGRSAEDYRGLTPKIGAILTGPRHALLRPEFAKLRPASLLRREKPSLKRLLITMGGVDKDNVTGQVLSALENSSLPNGLLITVVMGPKAPWLDHVRSQAALMSLQVQILVGVSDMATLMAESDLAIGAAGGTSWERCCLGLPTLLLVLAYNQSAGAIALQNIGAVLAVEHVEEIGSVLNKLLAEDGGTELMSRLSRAAAGVTEGAGLNSVLELMGAST